MGIISGIIIFILASKKSADFLEAFFTGGVVKKNGIYSAVSYGNAALQEKSPVSNRIRNFSRKGFSRENGVQESPQTFLNPEIKMNFP